MCIDIARDAMRMYEAGRSLKEIRAAVEQRFGAGATKRTPKELPRS